MSLQIDVNAIARILLQDGVWYHVLRGTLTIDTFELMDGDGLTGTEAQAGARSTGLRFKAHGMNGWIACPLASITAVHYESSETDEPIGINIPKTLADELGTSLG